MTIDWVVYGSAPWAGTWYTEHNLAHALAADARVLFVDPPMSPLTPLRAANTSPRDLLRRRPRRAGRVLAVRPLALPPLEHARARALSAPLVRAQVRRAVRAAGLRQPVVLAARGAPGLAGAAGERARIALIQDWVPSGAALLGRAEADLLAEVDDQCRSADAVVVISEALRERLGEGGIDATVVRHGFPADLREQYDRAEVPAMLGRLPRPRLVYAGGIDARLDFAALRDLAGAFPHGSVVLVGPVSPRLDGAALATLSACANAHVLPAVAREQVPGVIAAADCLLMPYVEDEWGRYGSPLKLWEYLYAGAPLAGSGYRVLAEYPPPLVHFASPPARLADVVAAALAEAPESRERRRSFALDNTWDERAGELAALAERAIASRADR